MAAIFLSYARLDRDLMTKVRDALQSLGHHVIVDERAVRPGHTILERLRDLIGLSDYMVVVLTPRARASRWVAKELRIGFERETLGLHNFIIPLLQVGTNPPRTLRHRVFLPFDANIDENLARRLLPFLDRRDRDEKPSVKRHRAGIDITSRQHYFAEVIAWCQERNRPTVWDGWWPWYDEDSSVWTHDFYCGIVNCCRYVIDCANVIKPIAEVHRSHFRAGTTPKSSVTDSDYVWIFATLSLAYIHEVSRGILHHVSEMNTCELDDEFNDFEFCAPPVLRPLLVEWCPPGDAPEYVLGWKKCLTWLSLKVHYDSRNGTEQALSDYLERVQQTILLTMTRYEEVHQPNTYSFWKMVRGFLWSRREGSTEALERATPGAAKWFEETLQIDKIVNRTPVKVADADTSMELQVLLLRSHYIYTGVDSTKGLMMRVESWPVPLCS